MAGNTGRMLSAVVWILRPAVAVLYVIAAETLVPRQYGADNHISDTTWVYLGFPRSFPAGLKTWAKPCCFLVNSSRVTTLKESQHCYTYPLKQNKPQKLIILSTPEPACSPPSILIQPYWR